MDEQLDHSASGRHWLALAAVLALALAVRVGLLALAWHQSTDFATLQTLDTPTYVDPAHSLLADGTFTGVTGPELQRTPGYPAFLALGIALGNMAWFAILVQIALSLATIALVFGLTQRATGSRLAAVVAGVLLAVEPLSVAYSCYMLTETLFTFLLVLSIVALAAYGRSRSLLVVAASAALLAAATLVRPVTYYLMPPLALALLVEGLYRWRSLGRGALEGAANEKRTSNRPRPVLKAVLASTLFLLVAYAPLATWLARNWIVAGYDTLSAVADLNLYLYQGPSVVACERHESLDEAQIELGVLDDKCQIRIPPEVGTDWATRYRYMRREGSRLVREHLLTYAQVHVRGMVMLMVNPGATDLLQSVGRYPADRRSARLMSAGIWDVIRQMHRDVPWVLYTNLLLAGGLALTYLLSCLGLWSAVWRWNWQMTLLALVTGYLIVVSGGPICVARLRHPVMPLVCVAAGMGAARLLAWRANRHDARNPTFRPAFLTLPKSRSLRQTA